MDVALTAWPQKHSYYAELIDAPPDDVRYHVHPLAWRAPLWGSAWKDALYWKARGARRAVWGPPDVARVPDWGMPIHSGQDLLDSRRPWVVDYEHPTVFTGFDAARLARPATRARLLRMLDPCGALLAWTEACAKATRAALPEVSEKIRVVRPAIRPRGAARPENPDSPLVLFVGGGFEFKGGREALDAFVQARRERCPNARMLMITNVGEDVQSKYRAGGVTFLPANQSREKVLTEGYAKASVFLGPTHFDTFGMVFLEAFAHGLPVVMSDNFGADEIVEHDADGFIVPGYTAKWFDAEGSHSAARGSWDGLRAAQDPTERPRIVARLAQALGDLLADPSLRRRMGEAAMRKVTTGAFSVHERNARLKTAYAEAFAQ